MTAASAGNGHRVPQIAVVMPTYDQDAWLPAAICSLLAQTMTDWECVVVDDGSPGDTASALADALDDPRVRLEVLPRNGGLGAALNRGLDLTTAPYVAYLPSDDVWHADHLATLLAALEADPEAGLAVAGVRHHQGLTATDAPGRIAGEPLQLVQVLHRRTDQRWVERSELTTDDLDRMLWSRLGRAVETGRVTCEWTWHPRQRHLVLREPWGGLNPYRARYRVQEPLRLQSTVGSLHDEVEQYREYRERPEVPRAPDGLRILLVGELAHNPERILALHERGHELHGLWTQDPVWFNAVGPLPFGHVQEVPRDHWRAAAKELRPDLVYALLNWQAVPFAHEVLTADLGVPFVWHVKEGPYFSRQHGHWPQLVDLHTRSDGQVYSSVELREWFAAAVPASRRGLSYVLDGDLPKAESFAGGERVPLLSDRTGDLHTVIPGRPLGPAPEFVAELAKRGVHLHLYGQKAAAQMRDWVEQVQRLAPGHLHLHPQVGPQQWVSEFSQYDGGWLHDIRSTNRGDIRAATWDDLNLPARMGTLAAAGVPMIQRDNAGHAVASQTLCRELDLGVFYTGADDLVAQLRDRARMAELRESVWEKRSAFTFDAHVDDLVDFFRKVRADSAR
jgi:glycosyltransferase involved in cell wall biosynthesis